MGVAISLQNLLGKDVGDRPVGVLDHVRLACVKVLADLLQRPPRSSTPRRILLAEKLLKICLDLESTFQGKCAEAGRSLLRTIFECGMVLDL